MTAPSRKAAEKAHRAKIMRLRRQLKKTQRLLSDRDTYYAKCCAIMVQQGITSFGWLHEAIEQLGQRSALTDRKRKGAG